MAIGLGLAIGALAAGILLAVMWRPNIEGQDMSAATLESFQITTTDEGSVIPWACGDVRLNTNLMWYGNLINQAIKQEAGGKGGGGGEVTTGFMYWMDLWHSICLGGGVYGNVTLQGMYVSDRFVSIGELSYILNDGTQSTFPTEPGQWANAMKGVAHIWFPQYYLGENVSFVPTFHPVIRCTSNAPLSNANLSNGVNPAARIYDILRLAGSGTGDFNIASFQTAATYWYNQGYGINLSYSSQKEARERIAEIFTYVPGCLRKDNENKWYLQAYDPADASVATFDKEDMHDFNFVRRSWSQTFNDFRGNFTDATQAYTRRTVRVYNGANQRLLGYKKQKTVDLTAFRDAATASKRLSEIMRQESYPEAQISFSADLEFEDAVHVGKVITVNNDEYGIANAGFRILTREVNEYNSNLLDFTAKQVVETLWDDTYELSSEKGWVEPDFWDVDPASEEDIFEMPYNSETGLAKAFLCLCARQNQEDGFSVIISANGADYSAHESFDLFSQHGTLDETYPNSLTTDSIDDSVGILYTPTREDPVFETITREALFYARRFAILDLKEIVAFQTVSYEGSGSIRLTGVVRGIMNTPITQHASGKSIWLVNPIFGRNITTEVTPSTFYFKYLPRLGSRILDPGDASSINHIVENKANISKPALVRAIRTGSTVTVDAHYLIYNSNGAGVLDADNSLDSGYQDQGESGVLEDGFFYRIGGGSAVFSPNSIFSFVNAGNFTLYVWRASQSAAENISVTIQAADGDYIFPTIIN